tara:strand:- start:15575 stop:16411 length:837 start_codon:yes stop_codon:yes gene_type:complete
MDLDMNTILGVPSMNFLNTNMANPLIITLLVFIIIIYFVLFASLGNNTESMSAPSSSKAGLEILLWGVFLVIIIINGMNYFLNVNIITSIKNLFSGEPEIDITVERETEGQITGSSSVPELKFEKQVYHIPGNKYTFDDARAVCKAYGNRLANYKEIENAYQNGADWCSYGWSEDQMALFPTQMERWERLQKIEGHENDCGRPGINGGYIANPNVRFGVNCYGYRPKITSQEAEMMKNIPLFPKTQKELDFQKRIEYWKNKISNIIVAPFNSNNWSIH